MSASIGDASHTGPRQAPHRGQCLPNGMLEDNYPRNLWWVAARADEITNEPLARWILELPIVLYRTSDGTPVALDDRCPHRWAPLSEGRVEGDEIVCPYHGMRYGTDGVCTRVPSQSHIPADARVRSYPLRESGAFIWIWMGDEQAIDHHAPPVDLAYTANPDWEDKRLLERLQTQTAKDPRGVVYPEINLRADGAGIRVRRVLRAKLEAERGRTSA